MNDPARSEQIVFNCADQVGSFFAGIPCASILTGLLIWGSMVSTGQKQTISVFQIAAELDPEWIHRMVATASRGFDTVPWNSFVGLILSMGKLNHKQAYIHIFWVSLVAPILAALLGVFFV